MGLVLHQVQNLVPAAAQVRVAQYLHLQAVQVLHQAALHLRLSQVVPVLYQVRLLHGMLQDTEEDIKVKILKGVDYHRKSTMHLLSC